MAPKLNSRRLCRLQGTPNASPHGRYPADGFPEGIPKWHPIARQACVHKLHKCSNCMLYHTNLIYSPTLPQSRYKCSVHQNCNVYSIITYLVVFYSAFMSSGILSLHAWWYSFLPSSLVVSYDYMFGDIVFCLHGQLFSIIIFLVLVTESLASDFGHKLCVFPLMLPC